MYENLKIEMVKKGITSSQLAKLLGIHVNTVTNKIAHGPFSIEEAFLIKSTLFPDLDIAYLFKRASVA